VIVAESDDVAKAWLERIPADRRPFLNVGTPEQMADAMRPYLDAGFTGFTFNNSVYRTPEAIGRVGELLSLVGGGERVAAKPGSVARLGRAPNQVDEATEDAFAVGAQAVVLEFVGLPGSKAADRGG